MFNLRLSLLVLIVFVFFQSIVSFSLSCTDDFSNTQFYTESGTTQYQLESENSINVINSDLSSHPLTIYMQKTANESGCYSSEDFTILEQSGTQTFASNFDEQQNQNGNIDYTWTYQLSQSSIISQQYVDKRFIHSPTHTSSNPVNTYLTMKVDINSPSITSLDLSKNSQGLQINPSSDNAQGLKANDQVELQVRGSDDISVKDISVASIQGGDIVSSNLNNISNQQKILNSRINLTQSPLSLRVGVKDEFEEISDETVEIYFDSQPPSIESVDITSYELTNSLDYKIVGEVVIEDDFSLNPSQLSGTISTPNSGTVPVTIKANTCETVGEGNTDSRMECQFSTQAIAIDSSYTAQFTFELIDEVDNTVEESFSKQISIDTNAPQITQFEVRNPLNNTNTISPNVEESSHIILRVNNPESELYNNVVFSTGNTLESKIRIEDQFNELGNDLTRECSDIDSTTLECEWEIAQDRVPYIDSFNISLSVMDTAGNVAYEEISVNVDSTIPKIETLELQERGNERNNVFESSERVRIEVLLEDAQEEEEINVDITRSDMLFKNSMESISFQCYFDSELDTQVCFTDTFNLNNGFEGNRSEPLEVSVYDNSGNSANASIDIKIYRIGDDESIDYYEFESSKILSPLNRRLVKEKGVDVYHKFNIIPKNNDEEYKIVQIELLGLASSGENEGEEVRLKNFELQNQTSLGVVRGDRGKYFLKSFMPQLLSVTETEDNTYASINVSIVKISEDTIYKGETLIVDLPVEFYDMPRDINSNIATVEKLIDDIKGVSDSRKNKEALLDYYMMYYDLCSTYNSISAIVHSVSKAWFLTSIALGATPAPTEPIDEVMGNTQKGSSLLGNVDGVMGKICMLANCRFSQDLLGNAVNSMTGTDMGSYMTGKKSVLGTAACGGVGSSSEE